MSTLCPVFSACKIYNLFVEIPRYLEIPPVDFCKKFSQQKTRTESIRSVNHFQRKCLQGLKSDLERKLL